MGKDSEFYKNKSKQQKLKLRELILQLPKPAVDFIHSKEQTTQPSTLISYSYDLLTFFRFLQSSNPTIAHLDVKKIDYGLLDKITPDDIEEYQSKRHIKSKSPTAAWSECSFTIWED